MNKEKLVKDSVFIEKWKKQMTDTMKRIHPDWNESDMDEVLDEMLIDALQVPTVTLDNNYTGETRETNAISVFDWAIKRKPLVAGNGTFYKTQDEAINPVAQMLDGFLKERKAIKNQMFAVEDKTSDLYADLDRG